VSRQFTYICIVADSPWHFIEMSQFEWFSSSDNNVAYVHLQIPQAVPHLGYYISVCKNIFFTTFLEECVYSFSYLFCTTF